jgi:hypothetical protein
MLKFLTKKVKWFSSKEKDNDAHDLLKLDWSKPFKGGPIEVQDVSGNLCDATFMEFAYIIDFDAEGTKLMVFTGAGKKPTPGWEYLCEKLPGGETLWVTYNGSLDLSLPKDVAYVVMHGLAYRNKRPGILARCLKLAKAPLRDVIRMCAEPELYDKYKKHDNIYSVREAKDMLDAYLKYRLSLPEAA